MSQDIIITESYTRCLDAIASSDNTPIFVSGEAGTGKSVLIDIICQKFGKSKTVVKAAPTGIAALNIKGVTLHSLFKLKLGVLTPKRSLAIANNMLEGNPWTVKLLRAIDILIIDEISMVRADILDAVDVILKRARRSVKPFGGVQVVLVGDIFQLPPVLQEEEYEEFFDHYETVFFFSSKVMTNANYKHNVRNIVLQRVFRQSDEVFKQMLGKIRTNNSPQTSIEVLNECCFYDPSIWADADSRNDHVTLCATNNTARSINTYELSKIELPLFTYEAVTKGTFNLKIPTPSTLELKVGAKVMFTRNSQTGDWVNGTIATIKSLSDELVEVELLDGTAVNVGRETWEIVKLKYNDTTKRTEEVVTASFVQYPLMLAWAMTIHKVQGLTFDHVNIDLGKEAFASGQTYVAFSRCRTLDGVHLARPLRISDIKVDPWITYYYLTFIVPSINNVILDQIEE